MEVKTKEITFSTNGNTDIKDITGQIVRAVNQSEIKNGTVTIFAVGSTAALSTIEYEPGLVRDLPELLEKIAPQNKRYYHNETWHDGNGHAHLRHCLIGPSLVVPFVNSELTLGTWQQIIFIDFDNRPRQRKVIVQIIGE